MRIYLLVYNYSCEEAKYLTGVRREKEAFERLIKERGVCYGIDFFLRVVAQIHMRPVDVDAHHGTTTFCRK